MVRKRQMLLLSTLVVFAGVSGWAARTLPIDMSFRPLFADDPVLLAKTQEFEREFGQPSGAYIGVILESEQILTPEFLDALAALSFRTAQLVHVVETRSLTTLTLPVNAGQRVAFKHFEAGPAGDWTELREWIQLRPDLFEQMLSADWRYTILWVRLDLPLADLAERQPVIGAFRKLVHTHRPTGAVPHFVGISVVEDAYAQLVLQSLAASVSLTVGVIITLLFVVFRDFRAVLIAMAGVCMAIPATLALMNLLAQAMTILNSMVPTMVLVIGVAQAIHMLNAFQCASQEQPDQQPERLEATWLMLKRTSLPCWMSALTTIAGFFSLEFASLAAIRDFGLNVAIGVSLVYAANMLLVPILLITVPLALRPPSKRSSGVDAWIGCGIETCSTIVIRHPGLVTAACISIFGAGILALPGLSIQQQFNQEVSPDHPLRRAQTILEQKFRGILGPEISVRRLDGTTMLAEDPVARLNRFVQSLSDHPSVTSVTSVLSYMPSDLPSDQRLATIEMYRASPAFAWQIGIVINQRSDQSAILVRTDDMGTARATAFVRELESAASTIFGPDYRVEVVGQWWLAQQGMAHLLHDMLVSFGAACLIVLPLLACTLRNTRLFLISILPNVFPMLFALGFMALLGIDVRIGTAMVLAIALGIAIDDTIHFLCELRNQRIKKHRPDEDVAASMHHTGRAIVYTSLVLIAGFSSMLTSQLYALRDMGIVSTVTLAAALCADLFLVPALYLLVTRRGEEEHKTSAVA